jgi:protein TonB
MLSLGLGQVSGFDPADAVETPRRLASFLVYVPARPELAKPAASRFLRRLMLLASIGAHGALAAALLSMPADRTRIGTDEKPEAISVELVAAATLPKPVAAAAPAVETPKPEKKPDEKKPVPLKRKPEREAPVFRKTSPVFVAPTQAAPVATAPSNGEAQMSSAAAETRAEGKRAYGRLVWQRIAERKPAGLRLPGTAYILFSVTPSGAIGKIAVERSSGSEELDALALRTISAAAPFAPPPDYLAPADLEFEIPFNFR